MIHCRSVGGRATDTCITDFLASKGLVDPELASADPPSQLCSAIVEVTKGLLLKGVREEIVKDEDMNPEIDCIMENLKNSDFSNYLLVMYVYEAAEGLSGNKKIEVMEVLHMNLTKTTFDSFINCQAVSKFGPIFDAILVDESSSEEEMDVKEDYCVRKRVADYKLIDMDQVKIEINPKNIDVSDIDCNVLYQKALKDGEDELVKSLLEDGSSEEDQDSKKLEPTNVACLIGVIREDNYIDQMLPFDYIKEMNLGTAKKKEMRDKFIKIMTKLAKDSSKCFFK